jgi:hypothetical protein
MALQGRGRLAIRLMTARCLLMAIRFPRGAAHITKAERPTPDQSLIECGALISRRACWSTGCVERVFCYYFTMF